MITKLTERQEPLEAEFEGENEGTDVDTSDTDNLGESPNEKRSDTKENSGMNGILGNIQEMLRTAARNMVEQERMSSSEKSKYKAERHRYIIHPFCLCRSTQI